MREMIKDLRVGLGIITKDNRDYNTYYVIDVSGYSLNKYGLVLRGKLIVTYSDFEYMAKDFENGDYGEVIAFRG
jgi:hypothetical protein